MELIASSAQANNYTTKITRKIYVFSTLYSFAECISFNRISMKPKMKSFHFYASDVSKFYLNTYLSLFF